MHTDSKLTGVEDNLNPSGESDNPQMDQSDVTSALPSKNASGTDSRSDLENEKVVIRISYSS